MKEVKHISTETKYHTGRNDGYITTIVRAKVTGYPKNIIEDYPGGKIHKNHVTFKFVSSTWNPMKEEPIAWIKDSLEYGMENVS
jgi:hypothetical protein